MIIQINLFGERNQRKILEWDFKTPEIKWFEDGSLNITENIFERNQDK